MVLRIGVKSRWESKNTFTKGVQVKIYTNADRNGLNNKKMDILFKP